MPITAARDKVAKNTEINKTSKNSENNKNDKNEEKNKYLRTNLI